MRTLKMLLILSVIALGLTASAETSCTNQDTSMLNAATNPPVVQVPKHLPPRNPVATGSEAVK